MEDNLININDYIVKLLNDRTFRKQEYRKFLANDYVIENIHGVIDADLLYKIICKARMNQKFRTMLSDILTYIDSASISDENFKALLKFPKKYRVTYLSCIGHTTLSFYQMQILNQYPLALEVFSWLFYNICKYDIFTTGDMLQMLSHNPDVQPIVIQKCIEEALREYGDSAKLDVAKQWLRNVEEKQ